MEIISKLLSIFTWSSGLCALRCSEAALTYNAQPTFINKNMNAMKSVEGFSFLLMEGIVEFKFNQARKRIVSSRFLETEDIVKLLIYFLLMEGIMELRFNQAGKRIVSSFFSRDRSYYKTTDFFLAS